MEKNGETVWSVRWRVCSRRRERVRGIAYARKRRSFGPAYTDLIRGRDGRYPVSPILRSERSRASKVETRLRAALRLALHLHPPSSVFRGVSVALCTRSRTRVRSSARAPRFAAAILARARAPPSRTLCPSRPRDVPLALLPLCP